MIEVHCGGAEELCGFGLLGWVGEAEPFLGGIALQQNFEDIRGERGGIGERGVGGERGLLVGGLGGWLWPAEGEDEE